MTDEDLRYEIELLKAHETAPGSVLRLANVCSDLLDRIEKLESRTGLFPAPPMSSSVLPTPRPKQADWPCTSCGKMYSEHGKIDQVHNLPVCPTGGTVFSVGRLYPRPAPAKPSPTFADIVLAEGPNAGNVGASGAPPRHLGASDAPFCDTCGNLTVRNGTCYRCLNCGTSMGCS